MIRRDESPDALDPPETKDAAEGQVMPEAAKTRRRR